MSNASNPEKVNKSNQREKNKRQQEILDIKAVMSTPAGRRLMWRLVNDICHYDTISAQNSGSMTYMLEGERNIGRIIKADVYEVAFPEWQTMEREYMQAKGFKETEDKGAVELEVKNGE